MKYVVLIILLTAGPVFAQQVTPTATPNPGVGNDLVEITIQPNSPHIHVGETITLRANGKFRQAGTQVQMVVQWSSSEPNVCQVSNHNDRSAVPNTATAPGLFGRETTNGTATGITMGTATITAQLGNVKGSTVITVMKQVQATPMPTFVGSPTPTATFKPTPQPTK